ncbi:MAG: disulfide bond formation regulator [Flavobacteriaceae bacterium]|nr:disulfide bond formation regulator [Flavobacteriaceae bacterium]
MKVTLDRLNDAYHFEAKGASGIPVLIDNKTGDVVQGASPMELLLMGVGGCSAIDIIMILKKQRQEITAYHVEVEGARHEVALAKPFEAIHTKIYLEGDIAADKAKRAARLSFDKYCSVSMTLQAGVKITYAIILNGKELD